MPQDFFVEETAELIKEKGVLSFFLLYFFLLLSYFITVKYSPQDNSIIHLSSRCSILSWWILNCLRTIIFSGNRKIDLVIQNESDLNLEIMPKVTFAQGLFT